MMKAMMIDQKQLIFSLKSNVTDGSIQGHTIELEPNFSNKYDAMTYTFPFSKAINSFWAIFHSL